MIKTNFKFRGSERFEFAGGEGVWVYINKKQVLHVIPQHINTTYRQPIICKSFRLSNASRKISFFSICICIAERNEAFLYCKYSLILGLNLYVYSLFDFQFSIYFLTAKLFLFIRNQFIRTRGLE